MPLWEANLTTVYNIRAPFYPRKTAHTFQVPISFVLRNASNNSAPRPSYKLTLQVRLLADNLQLSFPIRHRYLSLKILNKLLCTAEPYEEFVDVLEYIKFDGLRITRGLEALPQFQNTP